MELRPYQQECIASIEAQPPGAYLVQMATGMGKTVTFANIPRHGERMLILSHREELVEQPRKYFDCTYGVERAESHAGDEEVVSASVQSLSQRLERFDPQDFGIIICDESHHAAADTYRKIFEYFQPEKLIGFTATPNRGDKVRLSDIFQKIIFQRDLRWGIKNNYLCNILCKRVNIGFDLRAVHTRHGDYAPGELNEAMEGTADAIAQAYREHAVGATLIFAVNVHQAEEIAGRIKGAVVVTGATKDRATIINAFTAGRIPCIVNCMVFTEGTDIPRVETVIVARPTQSESLYAQMVGRGLRLYPGKERLVLIDCVGLTGRASLCTAPSLLGLDLSNISERKANEIQGDLFELPLRIAAAGDCPESWVKNVQIVMKWSQQPHIRAQWPELALLFHIPNGGTRDPVEGRHLKQAGVKPGVPDLFLAAPSGRYHGLFIEMKTDTGRTSEAQKWWIERLNAAGYFAEACHGWESAVRVLEWYLSLSEGMP